MQGLVKQTAVILFGNLFLASVTFNVYWQRIDSQVLLTWASALLVVVTLRGWVAKTYDSKPERRSPSQWRALFVASSFLQGATWCSFGVYGHSVLPIEDLTVLIIILTGLTGGAVAGASFSMRSFLAFAIPTLLPLGILLGVDNDSDTQVVGFLMCAFFLVTLRQVFTMHHIFRDSINVSLALEASNVRSEKLAEELYAMSTMDALTQVSNRRGFDTLLDAEWQRGQRSESPLAIMIVDVDHFKHFNDSLGHQAGDECLQEIAEELRACARRASDKAARYGGEEFAMILPNTRLEDAITMAKGLCAKIVKRDIQYSHRGQMQSVTVSIGVHSVTPSRFKAVADLVKCADEALYRAKANGRNRVESF
jgi:diguanylate cyclase (GGDEF)-like protein